MSTRAYRPLVVIGAPVVVPVPAGAPIEPTEVPMELWEVPRELWEVPIDGKLLVELVLLLVSGWATPVGPMITALLPPPTVAACCEGVVRLTEPVGCVVVTLVPLKVVPPTELRLSCP